MSRELLQLLQRQRTFLFYLVTVSDSTLQNGLSFSPLCILQEKQCSSEDLKQTSRMGANKEVCVCFGSAQVSDDGKGKMREIRSNPALSSHCPGRCIYLPPDKNDISRNPKIIHQDILLRSLHCHTKMYRIRLIFKKKAQR